jgi:hypothetical protein
MCALRKTFDGREARSSKARLVVGRNSTETRIASSLKSLAAQSLHKTDQFSLVSR